MSNTLVIVDKHKTKDVRIVPEFVSTMKHINLFAIFTFNGASVMSEEESSTELLVSSPSQSSCPVILD